MGDDDVVTQIRRARIRFEQKPTTASATGYYKMNEGDSLTTGPSGNVNDGKFDLRQSGRYHRIRFDLTGDHKEYAWDARPIKSGLR